MRFLNVFGDFINVLVYIAGQSVVYFSEIFLFVLNCISNDFMCVLASMVVVFYLIYNTRVNILTTKVSLQNQYINRNKLFYSSVYFLSGLLLMSTCFYFGPIQGLILIPLLAILRTLCIAKDDVLVKEEYYVFIGFYVFFCIFAMPTFSNFDLDSNNLYLFGYDNMSQYLNVKNPLNNVSSVLNNSSSLNAIFSLTFLLDSFSYLFVVLNVILTCLCIIMLLPTWAFDPLIKFYIILLLFISFILNIVFLSFDLLTFCITFELILLPMVCLIGLWGSSNRRQANNYLIFYTIIGAVPMLIGLMYIWMQCGTMHDLSFFSLRLWNWTWNEQVGLFILFLIPFAIKTPMVPVHIWLPKAHVDAPTTGSVILAGLLLKIGFFGFIRFLMPVFSLAAYDLLPIVAALATLGVVYSSLVNLRQVDLKRIIAYSSVAHMNMALVSLCLYDCLGGTSAIFVMFSHGFISSAMFFLIGFLYHRFHQRSILYYGGLSTLMPIFTLFLFLFSLANMSFPLTAGFIGEFLCLYSMFEVNIMLGFFNSISMFFTTIYTMLLFSRVCFGMCKGSLVSIMQTYLNTKSNSDKWSIDLLSFEVFILSVLLFFTFLFGIYPSLIFQSIWFSLSSIYMFTPYII